MAFNVQEREIVVEFFSGALILHFCPHCWHAPLSVLRKCEGSTPSINKGGGSEWWGTVVRIPSSCVRGWGVRQWMKPPSKSVLMTYPLHLESPWQPHRQVSAFCLFFKCQGKSPRVCFGPGIDFGWTQFPLWLCFLPC